MSIGGCFIDESGEEICEEESISEVSFCVEIPIPCAVDSDCPSHLRCASDEVIPNDLDGDIETLPVEEEEPPMGEGEMPVEPPGGDLPPPGDP
jgi:hypothetical protein